jgi:hypothetical protein
VLQKNVSVAKQPLGNSAPVINGTSLFEVSVGDVENMFLRFLDLGIQ